MINEPGELCDQNVAYKADNDKPCLRTGVLEYFPLALTEIARVSSFGSIKYGWGTWSGIEFGIDRYGDAALRHAVAQTDTDDESGLLHAAHEAWNAMARLELILRERNVK